MCTAPVGRVTREKRHACGNEYLVLDEPARRAPMVCVHGAVVSPDICKYFHAKGVTRIFPVQEEES